MKKILSILALIFTFIQARSQDGDMATGMRSSGKIYVVVAVIGVIFLGLVMYLFSIDRRVKKLEKKD